MFVLYDLRVDLAPAYTCLAVRFCILVPVLDEYRERVYRGLYMYVLYMHYNTAVRVPKHCRSLHVDVL